MKKKKAKKKQLKKKSIQANKFFNKRIKELDEHIEFYSTRKDIKGEAEYLEIISRLKKSKKKLIKIKDETNRKTLNVCLNYMFQQMSDTVLMCKINIMKKKKKCELVIKIYNKSIKNIDEYLEYYNACKHIPEYSKSVKKKIKKLKKIKKQMIKFKSKYDMKICMIAIE